MTESRLFKSLKIGNMEVKHRIGMAPLTRMRATADRVPSPLATEYYRQRASAPGTLIISEGTLVSPAACGGFPGGPGIWSRDQIAAWRTITDEVHRKGSFIFCQIFAFGPAADAATAAQEGVVVMGPSAIQPTPGEDHVVPRPMTGDDIKRTVKEFATAARNAVEGAGFDGVEIHAANGYLLDTFLQDVSNRRTDAYGGSVENRSRFVDEIMHAAVEAVGAARVGLRLSPWTTFQGMGMADPIPQFVDVIHKARDRELAYLHLVESRVSGTEEVERFEKLDFAYEIWDRPILLAGGFQAASAQTLVDEEYPDKDIVIVFGRYFISNPDLVYRIQKGLALSAYDRDTFYTKSAVGYVDYQFSPEYLASAHLQTGLA